MQWARMVTVIGSAAATAALLAGCGGGGELWGIDPELVASWEQTGLTEDGMDALFVPRVLTYRDNGTWRSDSADGSWSRGTYGTRPGQLHYTTNASDDPANVGHTYTFPYAVSQDTLTVSGHHRGHYYVSTFARLHEEPTASP